LALARVAERSRRRDCRGTDAGSVDGTLTLVIKPMTTSSPGRFQISRLMVTRHVATVKAFGVAVRRQHGAEPARDCAAEGFDDA
jgi:hypothetical protein